MPQDPTDARHPTPGKYRKLAELSSLGLVLPSSIAVGMLIGWLLDKLFSTHPWLLGIFTLLGVASGLLSLVRSLRRMGVEKDNDDER